MGDERQNNMGVSRGAKMYQHILNKSAKASHLTTIGPEWVGDISRVQVWVA
jgi:hypothetical protein